MHRDIVTAMPVLPDQNQKLELLGSSPKCQYQGFYCKNKIISVQGHPEFNEEIVTEILQARHKTGIFDDATFQDAISRVGNAQDGVSIAGVFLKFLLAD
jgi:GMP synthase-like glutamine amidotransferase